MTRTTGNILIAIAAAVTLVLGIAVAAADATQPDDGGEHKVSLCHRTASDTNPYVFITVDEAAVDTHLHNGKGHPAKTNPDGSARNDYLATSEADCTPEVNPSTAPSAAPSTSPVSSAVPSPTTSATPSVAPSPSADPIPTSTPTAEPRPTPTAIGTPPSTPGTLTRPVPTLPPTDAADPVYAPPGALDLIFALGAVTVIALVLTMVVGGRQR